MSKKQVLSPPKIKKFFINNLNSWLSNFIIEEFRTDHLQNSRFKNEFMGTVNPMPYPLPRLFKPRITKIDPDGKYNQEVFTNDVFIYSLENGNLNEAEFLIKGLKALKYEEEKTLIIISSIMTWRDTPLKLKSLDETDEIGFEEEEFILPEEEKEELLAEIEEEKEEEKKENEEIVNEKTKIKPGVKFPNKSSKKVVKRRDDKKKTTKRSTKSKEKTKEKSKEKKEEEKKVNIEEPPKITEVTEKTQNDKPQPTEPVNQTHIDKQTVITQTNYLSTLLNNHKIFYYKSSEYLKRVSNQKYLPFKLIENLALANSNPLLNVYIICPGYIYGCGEDFFFDYFRMAWLKSSTPIPIIGDGLNSIPTIHILDLVQVIRKILDFKPITRYIMAVDKTKNNTLKNILKSISKCFGEGKVETLIDFDVEKVNVPNYNEISIDLKIRPSQFLLTEKKKKNETDEMFEKRKFKWHCEYGIPDNLDKLRYEFSLYRNLKNQKIFVWGPPSSGKSTLSEKLSDQLRLPHIKLKDLIDIAKRRKNPLGEEIRKKIKELRAVVLEAEDEYNKRKNKKKTDPPFDPNLYKRFPDELIVKIVKARLMESDCLSKGFILDGYPKKYQDAIDLLTENNAISSLMPDSVLFISNLTNEILKERVASIKEYETDPDTINRRFERRYVDYKTLNETEGTKSVLDFFKENNVSIFNYDENLLKENEEEFKEQLKLYLNKDGEINNISRLTDQEQIIPIEIKYNTLAIKELQDQQKKAEEAKTMLEKAEGLTNVTIDDEEYKDVEEVEKNTINRIKELNKKEQKLLEKKSEVLRHYLIENVIPLLSRGILKICKDQPDDPVDALADFLFESCFKKEEAKDEMEENKEDNELVIGSNNISNH